MYNAVECYNDETQRIVTIVDGDKKKDGKKLIVSTSTQFDVEGEDYCGETVWISLFAKNGVGVSDMAVSLESWRKLNQFVEDELG